MVAGAAANPNICSACADREWGEMPEVAAAGPDAGLGEVLQEGLPQTPSELEKLLKLDSPSVLECFEAAEQAHQAIAETAALEKVSVPSPFKGASAPPPV